MADKLLTKNQYDNIDQLVDHIIGFPETVELILHIKLDASVLIEHEAYFGLGRQGGAGVRDRMMLVVREARIDGDKEEPGEIEALTCLEYAERELGADGSALIDAIASVFNERYGRMQCKFNVSSP